MLVAKRIAKKEASLSEESPLSREVSLSKQVLLSKESLLSPEVRKGKKKLTPKWRP